MSPKPYALGLETTLKIDRCLIHRFEQIWTNNTKKGEQVSVEEVQANIAKRDHIDSSRDDSPLIIPENAIVLSNDKEGLTGLFNIATAEIDKHFR